MSRYDYVNSRVIEERQYPFYALIMAAMRQADTPNQHKLQHAFPQIWEEVRDRYNSPGGWLESELPPYASGRNEPR